MTVMHNTTQISSDIFPLVLQRQSSFCSDAVYWRGNANYGRPIGQAIIFCSCFFFLLLSLFFSSHIPSGPRLDVYHTSTHDVALVQIQNAWSEMAHGSLNIQEAKICHICIVAQLCWAISSQLRHVSTIGKTC